MSFYKMDTERPWFSIPSSGDTNNVVLAGVCIFVVVVVVSLVGCLAIVVVVVVVVIVPDVSWSFQSFPPVTGHFKKKLN